MSEIYKRIRERRIELGLTVEELAQRMGYKDKSSISKIENGKADIPQSKVVAFAKALNTTTAYLIGAESDNTIQLPSNIIPVPPASKTVPLLGTIACGVPILAEENLDGEVSLPDFVHADFALRCKGDSMVDARILDGDIVYIRKQPDVENGEIAAVLIGDEATLKRVYKYPGQVVLQPANPKYAPMIYAGESIDDMQILGKAVHFLSAVR